MENFCEKNRLKNRKKLVFTAALLIFIIILAICLKQRPKLCQLYLQIGNAEEGERMMSLWEINEGMVHRYIEFGEDTAIFQLTEDDIVYGDIESIEIVMDGYGRSLIVEHLSVLSENGRMDYNPQQILENFEMQGVEGAEIQEDGMLKVRTGTGSWRMKGSEEFCMELSRLRKK